MTLAAADTEDLEILSARLQDATARLGDIAWLPSQRRFAILVNRYRWEDSKNTRVRSGLKFDGVLAVQSSHLKHGAPEAVISILALRFAKNAGEDPGGIVELVLAGGGALRLTVECLDAELTDLTGPWQALRRPTHEKDL